MDRIGKTDRDDLFTDLGGLVFARLLGFSSIAGSLTEWIGSLDVEPRTFLISMLLGYAVLGVFMDAIGMLIPRLCKATARTGACAYAAPAPCAHTARPKAVVMCEGILPLNQAPVHSLFPLSNLPDQSKAQPIGLFK